MTATLEIKFGKSLIYIENSNDPKTLPCGTPLSIFVLDDFTTLEPVVRISTYSSLSPKYDQIHSWKFP